MNERSVSVRNGDFQVGVLEGGSGDPLLFLHGVAGLQWTPFLDQLANGHTVIAPHTPGFGATTGTESLLDLQDLIYFYLDLLDALVLRVWILVRQHGIASHPVQIAARPSPTGPLVDPPVASGVIPRIIASG